MKLKEKYLVSIFLAVLLFATGLVPVLKRANRMEASALIDANRDTVIYISDTPDTIYSFSQLMYFAPKTSLRITNDSFLANIPNMINAGDYEAIFDSSLYSDIEETDNFPEVIQGQKTVLIFEFLYTELDANLFLTIFSHFKSYNFNILLIGSFTENDFFNPDSLEYERPEFFDYVDRFISVYPKALFVQNTLGKIQSERGGSLDGASIILDNRFIEATKNESFEELYAKSWFLRCLVQEIRLRLSEQGAPDALELSPREVFSLLQIHLYSIIDFSNGYCLVKDLISGACDKLYYENYAWPYTRPYYSIIYGPWPAKLGDCLKGLEIRYNYVLQTGPIPEAPDGLPIEIYQEDPALAAQMHIELMEKLATYIFGLLNS